MTSLDMNGSNPVLLFAKQYFSLECKLEALLHTYTVELKNTSIAGCPLYMANCPFKETYFNQ